MKRKFAEEQFFCSTGILDDVIVTSQKCWRHQNRPKFENVITFDENVTKQWLTPHFLCFDVFSWVRYIENFNCVKSADISKFLNLRFMMTSSWRHMTSLCQITNLFIKTHYGYLTFVKISNELDKFLRRYGNFIFWGFEWKVRQFTPPFQPPPPPQHFTR